MWTTRRSRPVPLGLPSAARKPTCRSAATTTRSTARTTTAAAAASRRRPNSDMIQEMRVESANFDASVGHGLGLQISMMTRAGTNTQRGTVNYQYWTNKLNALTEQQKSTFDDRAKSEFERAARTNVADLWWSGEDSGPRGRPRQTLLLRQLLARQRRDTGKIQGSLTIPANEKHLQGDFRPARLPNPAQYQIYDPLTTRPDPTNPNRMIRDPFPNNIIPRDRIFNPDGS